MELTGESGLIEELAELERKAKELASKGC